MHDVFKLSRDRDGNPEKIIGYCSDVTEHKKTEEDLRKAHDELEVRIEARTRELRKSEEGMRGAIESLQEGFVLFDADDRVVMINDVFRGIQPKAQEYLGGKLRFEDLVHASVDRGWVLEAIGREEEFIQERIELHRNPKGPMVTQFGDGRWYILRETHTPDGGIALTLADITELKRAEDARLEIESRFRTVVDGVPVAITLKDRNGNILIGNKTIGAWTNTDPSKITDMTLYDFYPKEDAEEVMERDRRTFETGEETVAEVTRTYPDGVTRTVLSYKCPVRYADGKVVSLATILSDITALKKAEKKLLKASEARFIESIEHIPNGVAILDKDDRFVFCNSAYRKHLGEIDHLLEPGTPFEEIVRGVANAGIVSEAKGDTDAYVQRRMDMYRRRVPVVHHIARDDRWTIVHDYEMADGGNYHVRTDITKLKQIEQEAREREIELSNVRRLNVLGEMAAAIAHELNQPLTVISSYAQGLEAKLGEDGMSSDDLLGPIEKIADQANRAGDIITGIRSLIGKREMHKEPIDLNTAIEEAFALLKPECEQHNIGVTWDLDDGLPQVMADRVQIQQVVFNLARNAMDAMSAGPCATSRLTICSLQAGSGNVEVAVKDTGPGFSHQEQEQIFEPFYTKKTHGLGLGLSICRSITEAYGGRIWVDTSPITGATIRFTLPAVNERQYKNV